MAARVLWLTKGLGLGGAERLLALTAARVDRARFEVDVAYLLPWKDAFVAELESHGVRTVCLGARRTVDLGWMRKLRALLRDGVYDLVHTHSPVPAAAARVLTKRRQPIVHTEHNVWERYRWGTRALNAVTFRRNSSVIAVSDGVAASIARPWWLGPHSFPPVETLHHGVDVDAVRRGPGERTRARHRLDLPLTAPVIGTVANFTPKKDHTGLVQAFARVHEEIPDVVLLLIGSGPLEQEVRARVHTLHLTDHVRFLGSRTDVLELLPALDVFVLGSRFEGLPISLLEAMAAEVPCVGTHVGGIPEAMDNGVQGLLVPAGDPERLADAVTELLRHPERRAAMGRAGASRVREAFSIERAVRRIEDIYEEVLT